jgi:hypothetical protein
MFRLVPQLFSRNTVSSVLPLKTISHLPHISFSENHADPVTASTIRGLVPHLKKLGYEVFKNEASARKTVDEMIVHLESASQAYQDYTKDFKAFNLNIDVVQDRLSYAENVMEFVVPERRQKEIKELLIHLDTLTSCYAGRMARLKLYQVLNAENIAYRGIDLNVDPSLPIAQIIKMRAQRDLHMSAAWQSKQPFFSRQGLNHVLGIQHAILAKKSEQEAMRETLFVYLHSLDPISPFEIEVRRGRIHYPLGLHVIDAKNRPEKCIQDEIIEKITHKVQLSMQQDSAISIRHHWQLTSLRDQP